MDDLLDPQVVDGPQLGFMHIGTIGTDGTVQPFLCKAVTSAQNRFHRHALQDLATAGNTRLSKM